MQHELHNAFFWLSILEGGLFLLSLLLFFTDPVEMVYIWYHLAHCFRSAIGLMLYTKIPRSHHMAANMSIPSDQTHSFDSIMHYLKLAAKDALTSFTSQSKSWLLGYCALTFVCLILDLINFFTQVWYFSQVNTAYADLALIIICSLFLFTDWYYLLWAGALQFKFPRYIAAAMTKMIFGLIEGVNDMLGEYLRREKQRVVNEEKEHKKRYSYVKRGGQDERGSAVNYPNPNLSSDHK
jgi:hypothetical protein